jgi:hypothetical protein
MVDAETLTLVMVAARMLALMDGLLTRTDSIATNAVTR